MLLKTGSRQIHQQETAHYVQSLRAHIQHLNDKLNKRSLIIREYKVAVRKMQHIADDAREEKAQLVSHLKQQQAYLKQSERGKIRLSKEISAHKNMILKSTELLHYKTDDEIRSAWNKLFFDVQAWAFKAHRIIKRGQPDTDCTLSMTLLTLARFLRPMSDFMVGRIHASLGESEVFKLSAEHPGQHSRSYPRTCLWRLRRLRHHLLCAFQRSFRDCATIFR